MYACGATPERTRPAEARVFESHAAMPATWVPWLASSRENARCSLAEAFGGGNERATMILALVKRRWPLGNPVGIEYPVGSKNGWLSSTPLSMIPIFTPCPAVSSPEPQTVGAP